MIDYTLDEIVEKVEAGDIFTITKDDKPIALIVPVEAYEVLLKHRS